MSKTVIVDGNSIGYANHHGTKLTSGNLETQAVFGFIKTMRELRQTYKGWSILVLWDGRAQWRYDLLPEYKSNRDDDPEKVKFREAYKAQRPYIARALNALGIRQVTAMGHEADDMAGYFVAQMSAKPGAEIVLITGDEDWRQLVRPGVTWRDLRDDTKTTTIDNFMDKTGYATPLAFLEGKCLQGDSSDMIKGVGGIGEDIAPVLLAEFGSVREFWKKCDSGEFVPRLKIHKRLWAGRSAFNKEGWAKQYTGDRTDLKAFKKHMDEWEGQGRILFARNFKLMQLLRVVPPKKSELNVDIGKLDRQKFVELCEELAFNSIIRALDPFLKFFE